MAQKTPEQIIEKYGRNVASAGPDYSAGIASPTRDWAQATSASEGRWKTGIAAAIQNKSFTKGVQKAGTAKWQERASTIGAERYVAAAPAAAQAYAAVAGQVMQAANAARDKANAMPNDTQDQRIQRAVAAMKTTSEFWKRAS